MEEVKWKAVVEGLLFASGDEGLTKKQLAHILEVDLNTIDVVIEELKYDYENTQRGMMLMRSGEIYQLTTKPEHAVYFQRLMESPQASRLSQAALEALSIIAYRQPITRVEVEEVRGVNSDRAIQTLVSRGLVEEKGRKEGAGRPILFGTTTNFLTYFGLSSLEDLPPLPEENVLGEEEGGPDLFLRRYSASPLEE
ncbi:SMC-Scp complex subunit ScpB [Bacillaceae bacterium S4-13-58]